MILILTRNALITLPMNHIKSNVCFIVLNCIGKNCEWQRNAQGELNYSLPLQKDSLNKWSRPSSLNFGRNLSTAQTFGFKYDYVPQVGTDFDEINDNFCY